MGQASIQPQQGQDSIYPGSVYPGQQANTQNNLPSNQAPQLVQVERPSFSETPRQTPNFYEVSTVQDTLKFLPKLNSFSTGLQGPFEINLRPLKDSRSEQREFETPILGRSSQMTGSTISVINEVLVIKSG